MTSATERLCQLIRHQPKPHQVMDDFVRFGLACVSEALAQKSIYEHVYADLSLLSESPRRQDSGYPSLMASMVSAYFEAVGEHEPLTDILVILHTEFLSRQGGEGLGQYFTPPDLAKLAGKLAYSVFKRDEARGRVAWSSKEEVSFYDPTCGAGGLLLASLSQVKQDLMSMSSRTVVAQDIDPFCCAMTSIQLGANALIHGIRPGEIRVSCGNTLLDEAKPFWRVSGLSVTKQWPDMARVYDHAIGKPSS